MNDSPYHRFQSMKLLAYAERSLLPITRGEMPYPIDWTIYPSNACNHKCTWCLYRQPAPDGHIEQIDNRVLLPREVLMRAVNDAYHHDAVMIHFAGGGEPLVHTATYDALCLAQQHNLRVALSTNGSLLTPEIAEQVDYLRISLNAGTPEQHWRTNHESDPNARTDWYEILARIKAAARTKRKDIGLGFVVDHENYQDIEPFCAVSVDCGVDFVHIRPAFYYDAEQNARVRAIMPTALAACERAKLAHGERVRIFAITEKFDGYWSERTYHQCRAVLTGICLRATGDFAVCQDRTDLTFGHSPSYLNGADFASVWHSSEHKDVIAKIHDGAELDKCPRCVWNKRNEIIDAVARDDFRLALI